MSYNIDTWRTKEISKLMIPIEAIYWLPDIHVELLADGTLQATGPSEGFDLRGTVDQDWLHITTLESYGEASGWSWDPLLKMLAKSKGRLVATQIWEGGDSITRLTVEAGQVTKETVEV